MQVGDVPRGRGESRTTTPPHGAPLPSGESHLATISLACDLPQSRCENRSHHHHRACSPLISRRSLDDLRTNLSVSRLRSDASADLRTAFTHDLIRSPHDLSASRRRCLAQCAACSSCRVVSFSPSHRDCSWFRHCRLHRLRRDVAGFLTVPAAATAGYDRGPSPVLSPTPSVTRTPHPHPHSCPYSHPYRPHP